MTFTLGNITAADEPYAFGWQDFLWGADRSCNPFDPCDETELFWKWYNGWRDAKKAKVRPLFEDEPEDFK